VEAQDFCHMCMVVMVVEAAGLHLLSQPLPQNYQEIF
jgi:hypothetical protein